MYCKASGKGTKRPHPTPALAEEEIAFHQYYNESQKNMLLQPYIRRKLNDLAFNVKAAGAKANPYLMKLVGETCSRAILTCGLVPNQSKTSSESVDLRIPHGHGPRCNQPVPLVTTWNFSPPFGFVNGLHCDSRDRLSHEQKTEWLNLAKLKRWKHCVQLLSDLDDFCLPTTCGYQFVFENSHVERDLRILPFFSLDGLGLAMTIEHGSLHHFLGSLFSHRTSLCVCKRKSDGKITTTNVDDCFLLVGWGFSGGSKEYNEKKRQRRE
jgi:hypothetical protein